jgi:hypothetical protein
LSNKTFSTTPGGAHRRYLRRVLSAGTFLLCILWCCLKESPSAPGDTWVPGCPHPDTIQHTDPLDPAYRIISPNGGETFHIGQQCTVRVTSQRSGSAELRVVIGRYRFTPPPFDVFAAYLEGNTSVDTVIFAIPDSFVYTSFNTTTQQVDTTKLSSVTDSCFIEIADYNHPQYLDYSDCYFRIKNP